MKNKTTVKYCMIIKLQFSTMSILYVVTILHCFKHGCCRKIQQIIKGDHILRILTTNNEQVILKYEWAVKKAITNVFCFLFCGRPSTLLYPTAHETFSFYTLIGWKTGFQQLRSRFTCRCCTVVDD